MCSSDLPSTDTRRFAPVADKAPAPFVRSNHKFVEPTEPDKNDNVPLAVPGAVPPAALGPTPFSISTTVAPETIPYVSVPPFPTSRFEPATVVSVSDPDVPTTVVRPSVPTTDTIPLCAVSAAPDRSYTVVAPFPTDKTTPR